MVERARLENEKSTRLVGSNPTLPEETRRNPKKPEETRRKEVMAEWLNATDCNFVPITVRRFKSFSPQKAGKGSKERNGKEEKREWKR